MPNIDQNGNYFRNSDFNDGELIKFMNAGEFVTRDFSKNKDGSDTKELFEMLVARENGEEKTLSVNKTSRASLKEKYGPITEEWVGKIAKVTFTNTMSFGKMTKVLVLVPVE